MESLFFNSDDALKLLLEAGADYTKEVSYGDPILHDVAMYGGLRTIEVVRAAKLPGIDINATNKKVKTALQLVQQPEEKPDGFVEALQIMLDAIRDQRFEATPEMVQSTMKYQRRSKTSQITLTLARTLLTP